MKSKIEKLEEFNWLEGRDSLTIAFDNTIIRKVNEIIDYLNSQSQPEEKGWKTATAYTGDPIGETTTTSGQDTPEGEETVDIYNPVTDTTYRIRKKQDVAEDKLEDTEDLRQELFTFFLWFRWNGEKHMNKSIEKMIKVYLEERELGDVLGKIEKQNKLKRG